MHEHWYSQQFHQYNDSFSSQWEIFGITSPSQTSEKLGSVTRLSSQDVVEWLEVSIPTNTNGFILQGSLCLIFTRHRLHHAREIRPCYLAFKKETYRKILRMMNLPSAYPYMRVNAGPSGNFAKYTKFDTQNLVSHLSFVIRVPHSPRTNAKAVWSLAVTWERQSGNTRCLFESLSDEDMKEVENYISENTSQKQHPLFLPTMLLDLLIIFYVDHRRRLEECLFKVESQLGITRGQRKTDAWDWDYELHRATTKHCNTVFTSLVYLERQLDFASRLGDFVLQGIAYCQEEDVFPPSQKPTLLRVSKELSETATNNQNFANCQQHQVLCLQKRAQALVSVMYSELHKKTAERTLESRKQQNEIALQ